MSLIVPSRKGAQILINICQQYADEFDVIFNGAKSQFMIFKGHECQVERCHLTVNSVPLFNTIKAVHLGHTLSTEDSDCMVSVAIGQFWRSFNLFLADFGHIYPELKCKLFKQYCCNFYGAPLWLLSSCNVENVCIAWRKALRQIWKLSPMTHCNIITCLSNSIPLHVSLQKRFCKFVYGIQQYGSSIIKTVTKVALKNPFSVFCNNYLLTTAICDSDNVQECRNLLVNLWYESIIEETSSNVNVLKDMIEVRDGRKTCESLSINDVCDIIDHICID